MTLRNAISILKNVSDEISILRPDTGLLRKIVGDRADIQLPGSASILRNVKVSGDIDTLTEGSNVQIDWRKDDSQYRPVVIASAASATERVIGIYSPDNITIKNTPEGLSIVQHSIQFVHLSFTPSLEGHTHQDSLQRGGWTVDTDGTIYNSATRITKMGQIALGTGNEIIKLDSFHSTHRIWAGNVNPLSAPFSVQMTGAIHSTLGDIGGWNITATEINSDAGNAAISSAVPSIRLGSTGYDTGTGFWVGKDGSAYKLYIGSSANKMLWDGTDLTITGTIYASAGSIGGWNIALSEINSDSGNAVINSSVPYIGLGATSYSSGNGFWAGKDSGVYKIRVGDPSGNKMSWDGTDLVVTGTITAAAGFVGGWTIGATSISKGNITLNSDTVQITAGNLIIDGAGKQMRSSNYVSGVSGFAINETGKAEFEDVTVRGEIRASVLTYGEITASNGSLGVFKGSGVLYSDFTATGSPLYIYISDSSNGYPVVFAAGDYLRIKGYSIDIVLVVVAATDMGSYYRYEVTVSAGAGQSASSGTAVINYGSSSDGHIVLCADGTVGASPNITFATGVPGSITTISRIGNLRNSYGIGDVDTPGAAFGKYESSKANMIWTEANGLQLRIHNTPYISLSNSGSADIVGKINISGSDGAISLGTTPPSETSGTGIFINKNGIKSLRSDVVQMSIDTEYGYITVGGGDTVIRDSQIQFNHISGGSVYHTYSGNTLSTISLGDSSLSAYSYNPLGNSSASFSSSSKTDSIDTYKAETTISASISNEDGITEVSTPRIVITASGAHGVFPASSGILIQDQLSDLFVSIQAETRITKTLTIGSSSFSLSDGQLACSGSLFVGDGTAGVSSVLNGSAGSIRDIQIQSGGVNRWIIRVDGAESSGDAGANLLIVSRTDAGAYKEAPISINRATGNITISDDLYNADWVDYSATSTVTGWAASGLTKYIYYKMITAKRGRCYFYITGTSNLATSSFTLPITTNGTPGFLARASIYFVDNGTPSTTPGHAVIGTAASLVQLGKVWSVNNTWTTTGTKTVSGMIDFDL